MIDADKWMERIKLGHQFKEKYALADQWGTWKQRYRGLWDSSAELPLNRVYSLGKAMLARVYPRDPAIMVIARRPEYVDTARIVEQIDNWLIKELKLKKQVRRALLDAYIFGTGILKIGYDSEFGFVPDQALLPDGETVLQVSKKDRRRIEYNACVKPGMPWALRVSPEDIVVPWGYSSFDEVPWVAHRTIRPLKDVQEDARYNPRKVKELQGTYMPRKEEKEGVLSEWKTVDPLCELWEVRVADEQKVFVLCEGKVLYEDDDPLQIEGFPYVFIVFNENPDACWGLSDVFMVSPQQKELNEVRAQQRRMRKYCMLKFLYKKGALNEDELTKLTSDELEDIGAGIAVEDDVVGNAITPLEPRNLTTELVTHGREIEADMRETFGLGQTQLGELSPYHGKTATEIMAVQSAAELRVDERRDLVADVIQQIVSKWNQLIFTYWKTPRVEEIVGSDGAINWVTYTGDQIRGEYLLEVNPETAMPVNRQVKYNITLQLGKMFANDPMIDQVALRRLVLSQFEWLSPGVVRLLTPSQQQPNPMQMQGGVPNAQPPVQMPQVPPGVRKMAEAGGNPDLRALSEMLGGLPEGVEVEQGPHPRV